MLQTDDSKGWQFFVTDQMPDELRYRNLTYYIKAKMGTALPTPEDFGMTATYNQTACRRGYIMKYGVEDDRLMLEGMDLNSSEPKAIGGVMPVVGARPLFNLSYSGLTLELQFTGSMIVFRNLTQEVERGIDAETVKNEGVILEMTLDKGVVISVASLSGADYARKRTKYLS